jgi:hypothetical protein
MSDEYHNQQPWQQQHPGMWRPHVPTPYVTHQDLAPMHSKIGSLEQGQQSVLQAYGHLRGEMLHGFDEIKAIMKEQRPNETPKGEVSLTVRELVIIAIALVIAGGFLGLVAPQLLSM